MLGGGNQLRIMNWNIQNFGKTKQERGAILDIITEIVFNNNIDLLIILEINTTKDDTASGVLQELSTRLNQRAGGNQYNTRLLSPGTGVEYYGFIIRDPTRIQPVTLSGGNPKTPVADCSTLKFNVKNGVTVTNLDAAQNYFPLVIPAISKASLRSQVHWPGPRLPCMALFRVAFPGPNEQYIPIIAAHTRPGVNGQSPKWQIDTIPFMYVPYRASQRGVNAPDLQLDIDNNQRAINNIIITGDFNIDYITDQNKYDALTNTGVPANNFVAANTVLKTHLLLPGEYQGGDPGSACFDNFFCRGGQLNMNIANCTVVNVPQLFIDKVVSGKSLATYYTQRVLASAKRAKVKSLVNSLLVSAPIKGFKESNKKSLINRLVIDTQFRISTSKFKRFIATINDVIAKAKSGRRNPPLTGDEIAELEKYFPVVVAKIDFAGADPNFSDLNDIIRGIKPSPQVALQLARIISDHLPVILTLNIQ